jgi:Subtilase family
MKIRLLATLTGLLLTLLTACTSTSNEPLEALANQLFGVSGTLLIPSDQGNCPIDELDIPGEIPRASGATGGLAVLTEPPYQGQPTAITNPSGTGQYVRDVAARYGTPARNTGILVVDDFQGGHYTLDQAVFDLPDTPLPTHDPLKRAAVLQAKLDELQALDKLPHGAFVFNHINALMIAAGYSRISANEKTSGLAVFQHANKTKIYVKAVDIEDFDTEVIAARVIAGLNFLRQPRINVTNIAVNMSFAVVPCSVRDDFRANRANYPTFETYRDELLKRNGGTTLADIHRAIITPVSPDPLQGLISGTLFQPSTVYIASAGNYELPFPMYAAAWSPVISVSSHDFGTTKLSNFSNRGEIMITGAWFKLTNPAGINGKMRDEPQVVYQGTSFSAPAVSVFTAIDLASNSPRCGMKVALPNQPDLAYAPTVFDFPWTRKNLSFTPNFNKLLKVAVQEKCGI